MQLFNEMFSESVLVVNTHGYVNNIGENLLYDIQDIVKPEYIVIMQSSG
jgi:polynucleotide 5'-kinase involved in rRNA processing